MKSEDKAAILARHRHELERHCYGADLREDLTFVAGVISTTCREFGSVIPVIVGGFAVELYTMGQYLTHDLDMITTANIDLKEIMTGLGFTQRLGNRYWTHPALGDVVEFPPPPLEGSQDRIAVMELDNGDEVQLIGIEDLMLNRLEEFVFWAHCNRTASSALQLILLLKAHSDRLDWSYIEREAEKRDVSDGLIRIRAIYAEETT